VIGDDDERTTETLYPATVTIVCVDCHGTGGDANRYCLTCLGIGTIPSTTTEDDHIVWRMTPVSPGWSPLSSTVSPTHGTPTVHAAALNNLADSPERMPREQR